jgi:hypothetical protein
MFVTRRFVCPLPPIISLSDSEIDFSIVEIVGLLSHSGCYYSVTWLIVSAAS